MSPQPVSNRFSQRSVLLGLILLVTLLLSIPYLFFLKTSRDSQIKAFYAHVLNEAQLIALAHEQWLQETRNILVGLSAVPVVMDGPPLCGQVFKEFLNRAEGFSTVLLANAQGDLLCAPSPITEPQNFADRLYFRLVMSTGKFAAGELIVGRVSGIPVVPMALPIRDAAGQIQRVLIVGRRLSWIDQVLQQQSFEQGSQVTLVDASGKVLAQLPATQPLQQPMAEADVVSAVLAQGNGVMRREQAQDDRIFGFAPLDKINGNLFVVVSAPTQLAVHQVDEVILQQFLAFLVVLLVFFIVLWIGLGKAIVQPTNQLLRMMNLVSDGNLACRIGAIGGSREFARIRDRFNLMVESLQRSQQRLVQLSQVDGLLGINNRRSFDAELLKEWQRARRERLPLTVLLLDVDYFKNYNDTYGHVKGDQCLQQVALICRSVIRRPPDVLARYGGEELIMLLPSTGIKGALQIAQRVQQDLQQQAIEHSASVVADHVTLSIGIASCVPVGEDNSLVEDADAALYLAKARGRNRIEIYEPPQVLEERAAAS